MSESERARERERVMTGRGSGRIAVREARY